MWCDITLYYSSLKPSLSFLTLILYIIVYMSRKLWTDQVQINFPFFKSQQLRRGGKCKGIWPFRFIYSSKVSRYWILPVNGIFSKKEPIENTVEVKLYYNKGYGVTWSFMFLEKPK